MDKYRIIQEFIELSEHELDFFYDLATQDDIDEDDLSLVDKINSQVERTQLQSELLEINKRMLELEQTWISLKYSKKLFQVH